MPIRLPRVLILPLALAASVSIAARAGAEDALHPVAADVASQLSNPRKPFVMLVAFSVPEGNRGEFVKAVLKARKLTVKEAGNAGYRLTRSAKDPAKYFLYERWKNVAALDSHLKQPYLMELLAVFDTLLPEGPQITVMTPVKQGRAAKQPGAKPAA